MCSLNLGKKKKNTIRIVKYVNYIQIVHHYNATRKLNNYIERLADSDNYFIFEVYLVVLYTSTISVVKQIICFVIIYVGTISSSCLKILECKQLGVLSNKLA